MRYYKFKVGKTKCISFEEGNTVIPIVEEFVKEKHEAVLAAHMEHGGENDQIEIGFNYLYVNHKGIRILFDTGKGKGELITCMSNAGISASDIDIVIITHGDGDHVGGLHHFEKAKIVMAKKAFDIWMDKALRDVLKENAFNALKRIFPEASIRGSNSGKERFATEVLPSLKDRLQLVDDGEEFLEGIRLFPTPGHREDHYSVQLSSEGETLFCLADAIRHGFQLKYSSLSSMYDSVDEQWSQTVQKIQSMDHENSFLYFANHVSFPGLLNYNDNGLLVNRSVKK